METGFCIFELTGHPQANAYLVRELEKGTTLSARALSTVDFSAGRLFAALPKSIDVSQLLNFETGIVQRVRGDGWRTLARMISKFIEHPNCVALVQDTEASIDDGWLQDYKYRNCILRYGAEIYWQIIGPDTAEDEILGIISSASVYPSAVFFYDCEQWCGKTELKDADLREIVQGMSGVAVGAFDEESFLLWWSSRVPMPFVYRDCL